MENSLFFSNVEINDNNAEIIKTFSEYSEKFSKQVYIIKSALGISNALEYDYDDYIVVLLPGRKIVILNTGEDNVAFEDFLSDFIEDLGYLSEKYEYKKVLGRPKTWKKRLICTTDYCSIDDILRLSELTELEEIRHAEFLISLLIGSVNDINEVGELPTNLLESIKRKIVLFDGDQSRFIYSNKVDSKRVTIQGLAGTGKTELLLHKLKTIYTNEQNSKIVFTCFNKILSEKMKTRIPEFFDFMKVEEQIKWNERLWVIPSWGSASNRNSGIYSYICKEYGIHFQTYSEARSFEVVCDDAIQKLKAMGKIEPCFDYILIDESQDFPNSFFELCETVSAHKVYVAGDIFQDIYDNNMSQSVQSDYLLNKCYRTDPKTLMFAHAVGMGLYENPVIRWLDDEEWKACGYSLNRDDSNDIIELTRKPLRRFEDIEMSDVSTINLLETDNAVETVINIIKKLKEEHTTICPNDIAVVFTGDKKDNYLFADILQITISQTFSGWKAVKGYETKMLIENAVFISNKNNIKGLEFPFVIVVVNGKISRNVFSRNTLYMMLTRSLVSSYLVIENQISNKNFIGIYKNAVSNILKNGNMILREPSDDEKMQQNQKVQIAVRKAENTHKPIRDIIIDTIEKDQRLTDKLDAIVNAVIEFFNDYNYPSETEVVSRTEKMMEAFRN